MRILLIHGPNLNLLGTREPDIYGKTSSDDLYKALKSEFNTIEIDYFQSNSELEIINQIQDSKNKFNGILINAAAFSHTSIAIADAIRAINLPVISVHISKLSDREDFRQIDYVADACFGCISGLGLPGYHLAMECLLDQIH